MAQIVPIDVQRRRKPPEDARKSRVARELLADVALVGRRIAPPAMLAAPVGLLLGAPEASMFLVAGVGLALWMSVVLDTCYPLAVVGPFERWLIGRSHLQNVDEATH